jgi:hypothetical protein
MKAGYPSSFTIGASIFRLAPKFLCILTHLREHVRKLEQEHSFRERVSQLSHELSYI